MNGDTLHIGLFDAMGHGIRASSITSLAISVYHNARRCGLDLSDTYRSIDKWVHAEHPDATSRRCWPSSTRGTAST